MADAVHDRGLLVEGVGSVGGGVFRLEVSLEVGPGEVVAVVGPNGAGKSSLLRLVAGLVRLDSGAVAGPTAVWDEPAAGRFVPSWDRRVAWVPQSGGLWPDRSVLANVAFAAGDGPAHTWLQRLDADGLADRRPATLSGGERQRVALARALASAPDVVLLDEPLSAVDAPARADLRRTLARVLAGFGGPALVVTHEAVEAATLADRIVVLEDGRVTHDGPAAQLAGSPRTPYVADLVGVNLLRGRADGDRVHVAGGGELVVPDAGSGDVVVTVHPRAVAVHVGPPPAGSPRNVIAAVVDDVVVEPFAQRVRVSARGRPSLVAELTPAAVDELGLVPGTAVHLTIKATDIGVEPA